MTLSDGCLGSGNDEERSEMRYVMRIAEFSESSNLWTQIALRGFLGACFLQCRFQLYQRLCFWFLLIGAGCGWRVSVAGFATCVAWRRTGERWIKSVCLAPAVLTERSSHLIRTPRRVFFCGLPLVTWVMWIACSLTGQTKHLLSWRGDRNRARARYYKPSLSAQNLDLRMNSFIRFCMYTPDIDLKWSKRTGRI